MSPADLAPEVNDTLDALRALGLKLAIGSSSKNAPFILTRLGLEGWFDAVSDGNCISRSKPDPEVFRLAAEMLGLEPHECLVVEDAFSGIDAGLSGGFDTAAIGDATRYDKPNYKLGSFSDLLKIVKEE